MPSDAQVKFIVENAEAAAKTGMGEGLPPMQDFAQALAEAVNAAIALKKGANVEPSLRPVSELIFGLSQDSGMMYGALQQLCARLGYSTPIDSAKISEAMDAQVTAFLSENLNG